MKIPQTSPPLYVLDWWLPDSSAVLIVNILIPTYKVNTSPLYHTYSQPRYKPDTRLGAVRISPPLFTRYLHKNLKKRVVKSNYHTEHHNKRVDLWGIMGGYILIQWEGSCSLVIVKTTNTNKVFCSTKYYVYYNISICIRISELLI